MQSNSGVSTWAASEVSTCVAGARSSPDLRVARDPGPWSLRGCVPTRRSLTCSAASTALGSTCQRTSCHNKEAGLSNHPWDVRDGGMWFLARCANTGCPKTVWSAPIPYIPYNLSVASPNAHAEDAPRAPALVRRSTRTPDPNTNAV